MLDHLSFVREAEFEAFRRNGLIDPSMAIVKIESRCAEAFEIIGSVRFAIGEIPVQTERGCIDMSEAMCTLRGAQALLAMVGKPLEAVHAELKRTMRR